MTITDIQRGDNSIYAVVDGTEYEFKGGECPEDYAHKWCDNCGREQIQNGEDWQRVLYCSIEAPQLLLCSDCLKRK